jgi:hypothetical protein
MQQHYSYQSFQQQPLRSMQYRPVLSALEIGYRARAAPSPSASHQASQSALALRLQQQQVGGGGGYGKAPGENQRFAPY